MASHLTLGSGDTFKLLVRQHRVLLLKIVIHLMSLLPLMAMYYLAITDQLGGDPVEAVLHFTGIGAFNLLLLSLAVSPLAKKFKQGYLIQVRRLLGLYSFSYALFHLTSFLAFEVQFNFELFVNEIIDRPYITVGMAAFTILLALTITSVSALKRKMGRHWQQLHNGVYGVVLLVALHFLWSVKSDISEPMIYLLITLFLLSFRRDKIRRWFK